MGSTTVKYMKDVAIAVVILIVTATVAPLADGWTSFLRGHLRRDGRLFDIAVDSDPAIIWNGAPPWVSFEYFLAHEDGSTEGIGPPPQDPRQWRNWVQGRGGVDYGEVDILITIVAWHSVTIVVDSPIIEQFKTEPRPPGFPLVAPAGGASLHPRGFRVELGYFETPITLYEDEGFEPTSPPGFSLAKGDVERFHIRVRAEDTLLHRFRVKIPVLVDARRRLINLPGEPEFALAGRDVETDSGR